MRDWRHGAIHCCIKYSAETWQRPKTFHLTDCFCTNWDAIKNLGKIGGVLFISYVTRGRQYLVKTKTRLGLWLSGAQFGKTNFLTSESFFKNGPTLDSFSFIFIFSKRTHQSLQQINVKNVHPVYSAGIRTHDHDSLPLTTRPGLPPNVWKLSSIIQL